MSDEDMRIVDFRPDHAGAWSALNTAWLVQGGFALEAKDRKALDDPEGTFLANGGRIFIAEQDGRVVGCCALIRMDDGFEVSKMTVTPAARGRGLARRLLEANDCSFWEADPATLTELQGIYGDLEDRLEGVAVGERVSG